MKRTAGVKVQRTYVDRTLIFVVLFLLCFGLIMIYSASAYAAMRANEKSTFYLFSQARATILGIIGMVVISRFDYHLLRKLAWPAYGVSLAFILAVLTPLGMTKNGARRWLNIFGLSLQPAEICKLGMIVFFAAFICANVKRISKLQGFMQTMILTIVPCLLVYGVTDNLSTAIICAGIVVCIWIVATPKLGYLIPLGIVSVLAGT